MKYKSFVTDTTDPYKNLATEEYLFRYVDSKTNILFLWQNDDTIVVGRNQDVKAECKDIEFLKDGGRIARRRSGGGAVYHDLGNMNFSLIGLKENVHPDLYKETIASLVYGFGIKAEFSGRNDLLIEGRKFSGNAIFDDGRVVCQHGTILLDCNIERMTYCLTPSTEKMNRHAIKSVSSRVVNLREILPDISVSDIIKRMQELLGAETMMVDFDQTFPAITERYADRDWIYGGRS